MLRLVIFSLLVVFSGVFCSHLELVSDDDLLNHIKNENFVVVLFSMFFPINFYRNFKENLIKFYKFLNKIYFDKIY